MFLRLIINKKDDASQAAQGIFVTSWQVVHAPETSKEDRWEIKKLLVWFDKHLPSPTNEFPPATIFWYKSEKTELIKKTWELASLLRKQGLIVGIIKTEKPGYIFYEDDYQIGAQPFKDTFVK